MQSPFPSASASTACPLVSIVIPTRNEADDIEETLQACLALQDQNFEVLVIDDSQDETPDVVRRFASQGVRLHHRPRNDDACCGARNEGIRRARGEVVVLLNADARPEPDFLTRLRRHYESGAAYVVVRSEVQNADSIWGRFLATEEALSIDGGRILEWSEGFSCLVDAALSIGGIPGRFTVPFCRDWRLGEALGKAGFRKAVDLTIRVPHRVPDRIGTFWRNQVWRGTMVAPATHYLGDATLAFVCLRETVRACRTAVHLLFLTHVWRSVHMCRYSRLRASDIPGLALAGAVREVAFSVGTLKGVGRLLAAQRQSRVGDSVKRSDS